MAEKLTENDKYGNNAIFLKNNNFTIADDKEGVTRIYGNAVDKLAQFEDTLEKYDIESIEQLDYYLYVFQKMRKEYGKLNQENCKNKKERDIWKRACELACKDYLDFYCCDYCGGIGEVCENCSAKNEYNADYYYKKAKKELEDEQK